MTVAINVVEILVKAKDMTGEGFAAADAQTTALGSKLSKFGAYAGAGFAVVGYEAAKMAIGFDAQMTMLTTQAGVSNAKLGVLKQGVLSLASVVGFSPDSLAQSLYHVASNMESMGATSAKELAVVKVAAEGAKVGGADLVDVTNALTAAVASGIPGVQNYSQAMGMLNATVGAGDMKMQDLAEAFGSGMVATVKGFGLTLKDVGAALAVFGDNNIRGAHAGTQLRMSVMALAAPTAAGAKIFAQWGMSQNQLAKDMQHGGLMPALQDLMNHMRAAGIGAKQQGMIITEAFGKKAGAGLNVLLDQMDRLKSKYPAITAGADKFGQAWATTGKTLKQQLSQLKAGFDSLMISIGEKLIPVIQAVVGWMLRNKTAVQVLLAVVGTLAGVLFTYWVVTKSISMAQMLWADATKLVTAAQWLLNVAMSANPIGLVVIAIAALVGALIYAYFHFKTFRKVVDEVFTWIKGHWPLLLAILTGPVGLAVLFIVKHWNQIRDGAISMVHDVVHWFENLPHMILHALGDLGHLLWQGGVNLIMGLVHGIESVATSPVHALSSIVSGLRNLLPFSPARAGPLSGSGSPDVAGRRIAQMLAQGIDSGHGNVAASAARMAAAAGISGTASGGAGGAGGGGVARVQLEFTGSNADILNGLMKMTRLAGGDPRIFTNKPRFA
jgi:TP901 family phage tail tape measure protein